MGKHRKQRQKLHVSANINNDDNTANLMSSDISAPLLIKPTGNLFDNINLDNFKKSLNDDTRSVKSFKSLKSEYEGDKAMTKKDKIKLRKEFLLKKIDTINQMKKEAKLRSKCKNLALIGDINPLYDALPSLESLLKSRSDRKEKVTNVISKPRRTQKANKRKKNLLQNVQMYKQLLSNKKFRENPLASITEHVKAVTEQK